MNVEDSYLDMRQKRNRSRTDDFDLETVLRESYVSTLNRFIGGCIVPMSQKIRNASQTETLLRLLLTSLFSCSGKSVECWSSASEIDLFQETVGFAFGYSFSEGFVIDFLLREFENEIANFELTLSLNHVKGIIASESGKTFAKGAPFEAVVLADLINLNGRPLSDIISSFGITLTGMDNLTLPTTIENFTDEYIISERPTNVFIRPSKQFGPEILVFLSKTICLSFGLHLNSSPKSMESTDPNHFFLKNGQPTNIKKQKKWQESISLEPLTHSILFSY
jgi:hypothetical protein